MCYTGLAPLAMATCRCQHRTRIWSRCKHERNGHCWILSTGSNDLPRCCHCGTCDVGKHVCCSYGWCPKITRTKSGQLVPITTSAGRLLNWKHALAQVTRLRLCDAPATVSDAWPSRLPMSKHQACRRYGTRCLPVITLSQSTDLLISSGGLISIKRLH